MSEPQPPQEVAQPETQPEGADAERKRTRRVTIQEHRGAADAAVSQSSTGNAPAPSNEQSQNSSTAPTGTPAPKTEEEDSDDDKPETNINRQGMKADFEGFLQKKGNKGLIKVWSKRYFRVYKSEGHLCYFKSDKVFNQIGAIYLPGALTIEKSTEKPFAFNIIMKTSARVWRLAAKDEKNKQEWLDMLMSMTPAYIPPQSRKKKGVSLWPVNKCQYFQEPENSSTSRHHTDYAAEVPQKQVAEGDVSVCIFGDKVAFVQEVRKVELDKKRQSWITNVPKTLRDTEAVVHVKSISDPTATITEQSFLYDEKVPEKLLPKLVGKEISVDVPREDAFKPNTASFKGLVQYERDADHFALYDKGTNTVHFLGVHEPVSYHLQDNHKSTPLTHSLDVLLYEPTICCTWETQEPSHLVELTYSIKHSFEWHAEFTGVLNYPENEMEITGWYSIKNKSGKTYENANIVLVPFVSSESDEEEEEKPEPPKEEKKKGFGLGSLVSALTASSSSSLPKRKQRIRKYHPGKHTDLADGATKQLRIVSSKIPVRSLDLITFNTPGYMYKPYIAQSFGTSTVASAQTVIQFLNSANHGLGTPLPAGKFNLLRREKDGFGTQEVAISSIGHHDPNDIVTVVVEPLENVVASRRQTGYNLDTDKLFIVETFEIFVRNNRLLPVHLVIEESMFRWQSWEIPLSSHPFEKHHHPRKILWKVSLDTAEETTISYTVFYNHFELD